MGPKCPAQNGLAETELDTNLPRESRTVSGTRIKSVPWIFTYCFSNDVTQVGEIVDQLLKSRVLNELEAQELALALRELLLNAMEHGNLGFSFEEKATALAKGTWKKLLASRMETSPYCDRTTLVTATWAQDCVEFTIADEGLGFDWRSLPDPTDPENILRDHGRGVLLARLSVNTLRYNKKGNEVTIVKQLR